MKASEYRNKSAKELNDELMALRKEQFNLRMQKKMGQLPKTHLMSLTKKNIARLKTVLNEKSNSL